MEAMIVSKWDNVTALIREMKPELKDTLAVYKANPLDVRGKVIVGMDIPLSLASRCEYVLLLDFALSLPEDFDMLTVDGLMALGPKFTPYCTCNIEGEHQEL